MTSGSKFTMLQFFVSQRGGSKLSCNGHVFMMACIGTGEKAIWGCDGWKLRRKARLHTINGDAIKEIDQHNHEPVDGVHFIAETPAEIRFRAKHTENTGQILNSVLTNVSTLLAHLLPSRETLARDARRHRPTSGLGLDDIRPFSRTVSGEQFHRPQEDRMVVLRQTWLCVYCRLAHIGSLTVLSE